MLMRKLASVFLALVLLLSAVLPAAVSATEANKSGWIELLEYGSITASGSNTFNVNGTSGSVTVPVGQNRKLRKIDMLVWNPTGQRFTSATVTAGGKTNNLEVAGIGSNLTRICGYIPDAWYTSVRVDVKKSTTTTQTYEVLSCKVTPIGVQEFVCNAEVHIENVGQFGISELIGIDGNGIDAAEYSQICIYVRDWYKYDTLTIWGSANSLGVASIRASLDTLGLPFSCSYFQTSPSGYTTDYYYNFSYSDNYSGDGGSGYTYGDITTAIEYGAKTLFCITIDLTGVDRSLTTSILTVYLTGQYYGKYGYWFNCQYVNGSLATADTSDVIWWNRFTQFMTDLFSPDSLEADSFQSEAQQKADEMEQANQELEQVTRPPVEDIPVDLDSYVSPGDVESMAVELESITSNSLFSSLLMMGLLVALVAYVLYGKR